MTIRKIQRAELKANVTVHRKDDKLAIVLELHGMPEMLADKISEMGNEVAMPLLTALFQKLGGGVMTPEDAKALGNLPKEDMSVH